MCLETFQYLVVVKGNASCKISLLNNTLCRTTKTFPTPTHEVSPYTAVIKTIVQVELFFLREDISF